MVIAVVRRLLRRVVLALVSRRLLALGLVGAALLVGVGVAAFPLVGNPGSVGQPAVSLGQGREVAEAFLRGNQNYDADLVWSSYGEEGRRRLQSRGGSPEQLQRQLATARERGTKIEGYVYIGGHRLQNGSSMHFYVVTVTGGQTQGERESVPYVFTLDPSGKIARVQ